MCKLKSRKTEFIYCTLVLHNAKSYKPYCTSCGGQPSKKKWMSTIVAKGSYGKQKCSGMSECSLLSLCARLMMSAPMNTGILVLAGSWKQIIWKGAGRIKSNSTTPLLNAFCIVLDKPDVLGLQKNIRLLLHISNYLGQNLSSSASCLHVPLHPTRWRNTFIKSF